MATLLRDKTFTDEEPVKLSICSLAFNHQDFIEECFEGFLEQICDFRIEIIIYDDASTDRTADIIRTYAERYPSIFRMMLQEKNQYSKGVNPYFAYVFPAARGEYIAICDGDDFWNDPNKLARQVAILDAEPDIALTYGPVRAITEAGVNEKYEGGIRRDTTPDELKEGPPINTLTSCFRNIYRDKQTDLFIRTSPIGDLTVWAMLGYHGGGRFIPDLPRANYRIHQNGLISMQSSRRQKYMSALAYLHIAAYHDGKGDSKGRQAAIKSMLSFQNKLDMGYFSAVNLSDLSLKHLIKLWAKSLKHRIRKR